MLIVKTAPDNSDMTLASSKGPITHPADRKQIDTGSKTEVETNDRHACWVISRCRFLLLVDTAVSALFSFATCMGWLQLLLKSAVITTSYASVCPAIRGNSQKAWQEKQDCIMRAETIKKLVAPNMINYTHRARHA